MGDTANNKLRAVLLDGTVTTLAGSGVAAWLVRGGGGLWMGTCGDGCTQSQRQGGAGDGCTL